jgi:signal transduction histidine kinase
MAEGRRMNGVLLIGGVFLSLAPSAAQTVLSLQDAGARTPPTYSAKHEGQRIVVEGVVGGTPVSFQDYSHLSLADDKGFGLTLEAPEFMFERISPGDHLEVKGVLALRDGLAVLRPEQIRTLSRGTPPEPRRKQIAEMLSAKALGLIVAVEGRVVALSQDDFGEYLSIEDKRGVRYPVMLPHTTRWVGGGLSRFRVGDLVSVSGIAGQADYDAPFDKGYRLVIRDAGSVTLLERHWLVAPQYLALLCLALITGVLWMIKKRRDVLLQRRSVRRIHGFCEELLTATSADGVIRKLQTVGPKVFEVGSVDLYRYDRPRQVLAKVASARVVDSPDMAPASEVIEKDSGAPVAVCFRNRTPLYVSDARRSLLFRRGKEKATVSRMVLLPMYARDELLGILELSSRDRRRPFGAEELAAFQHLANQTAIVLRHLDHQATREQKMRSEKLAATGELIAGMAGELKRPLETIVTEANKLVERGNGAATAILNESMRVSSILSHLTDVIGRREVEASPIEMNQLLSHVAKWCSGELAQRKLRLDLNLCNEPAWVLGASAQMDLVLRNLVMLAARSAEGSQDPSVGLECEAGPRCVLVRIRYGALWCDESFPPSKSSGDEPEALGFGVCRGLIHSLGGELRILGAGEGTCRLEIDLPSVFPSQTIGRRPPKPEGSSRVLTALLLDTDAAARRRLVADWTSRGHRAVPVQNETEALDLLRLVRIDAIFCAVRIAGNSWVDFFDKARRLTPVFVLMPDGLDSDVSRFFPEGEGLILRKPMETGEMDRLLDQIEQRLEATPVVEKL